MKILAKKRLTASKTVDVGVIYTLYEEDSGFEYEFADKYEIEPNSLIEFARENNVLEFLAKYWIKTQKGLTGNFGFDLQWYHEYNSEERNPLNFINWLLEDVDYGNMNPLLNFLQKTYLNLAKTKYRKYVYPVIDTYYYDQVFPEFKDFDLDGPEAEKYNETGDLSVFEDYVKSTGFR